MAGHSIAPEILPEAAPGAATHANPLDPYLRQAQTFPVLAPELIDRLRPVARMEAHPSGTLLFEQGQRAVDFFVVLRGEVVILEEHEEGECEIHAHGAHQFTGELDLLNGREILVSGRTRGETHVLRVPRESFRHTIMGDPEIGEVVMRAFVLRRTGLSQHGQGAVALLGEGATATSSAVSSSCRATASPTGSWRPSPRSWATCTWCPPSFRPCSWPTARSCAAPRARPRRRARHDRGAGPVPRPRRGGGGGGAHGPCRGRVRGLRGARHHRGGGAGAGGPGGHLVQDRELPGLSHGHLGPGARRARPDPGPGVRRPPGRVAPRSQPRLHGRALPRPPGGRPGGRLTRRDRGHRRALPQARRGGLRPL